jgi:acetoacetyl-CoA synthetase
MEAFRRAAEAGTGLDLADHEALHRWTLADPGGFWSLVWDQVGVIGEKGKTVFSPGVDMRSARFFPDARLNVAENMLEGRGRSPDGPAIEYRREDGMRRSLSLGQLRAEAAAFAAALRAAGVQPGDRVAAWMPHVPETVVAMLGAASIGAVFTSTSSDFGTAAVVDRLGQVKPVILIAADGYFYGGVRHDRMDALAEIRANLPSVQKVVIVGSGGNTPPTSAIPGAVQNEDFLRPHRGTQPSYARLPFDHPLYILYSSGTTGKPKCIVHRAGGVLIKHMQEQQHHLDVRPGDRVFYFTTCGWMMWNWQVSALASGATLVLFDGNPLHPGPEALFDLTDDVGITLLGVSAKFIDAVAKRGIRPVETHRLETLRTIASTGSPLAPEGFRFVYQGIKSDVHLASISGGTDLCGCLVGGDPTRPVYAGEIQGPALGMAIETLDEDGKPLRGEQGELVCTAPFPSMPLTFWGEGGDERYRAAYFDRFPGVWTHGDYASWTEHGGIVILGRSDATLNAGGVRIGTAEIYRIVERFPDVAEGVAVSQRLGSETRAVMFLRISDGAELTPELEAEIRRRLRTEGSPRHVPAIIATVADIPRTRNGKISELAVAAVVNGDPVKNAEALANPEALELFRDRPELRSADKA